jgi:hypothetical protein
LLYPRFGAGAHRRPPSDITAEAARLVAAIDAQIANI